MYINPNNTIYKFLRHPYPTLAAEIQLKTYRNILEFFLKQHIIIFYWFLYWLVVAHTYIYSYFIPS
jgi:hypothetical protein